MQYCIFQPKYEKKQPFCFLIYNTYCLQVYHAFYKPLEYSLPEQNHKQCYMKIIATDPDSPLLGIHFLGPNAGEVTQGFAVAMK